MLSILIVNWNTRELLRACLASIERFPPSGPHEIIVVDNASSDGSAEMVRSEFPAVAVVPSEVNTGYAGGNNLAFGRATGPFLLTLNPDTEFNDNSLDLALQAMERQVDLGALGIRQVGVDGGTQASIRGFPSVRGIVGDLFSLGGANLSSPWNSYRLSGFDYDKSGPAPQPMGTFLLFRREALEAVGDPKRPFDERFPIFFNEVDLLYRLKQAGWPCGYLAEAHVLHHGGESTKQVRKPMIWESHLSLVRYFRKHYSLGIAKIGLPVLAAVVYLAAFVRARGFHGGFRA